VTGVCNHLGLPSLELSVSDQSEFTALREWLDRVPDIRVTQVSGEPGTGRQGAVDVLTILAGSGGALTVAITTLPAFIRSRRGSLTITLREGKRELVIRAENISDAKDILDWIFRG
jgi:Effector Associated Constant Component 1